MKRFAFALPSLALAGLGIALLLAPIARFESPRAVASVGRGFKLDEGAEVRRKASIGLPDQAVHVGLRLSGPAQVLVRSPQGEQRVVLETESSVLDFDTVGSGGGLDLATDAAFTVHEVRLQRLGANPIVRLSLALAIAVAGAVFAARRQRMWPLLGSSIVVGAGLLFLVRGTVGGTLLASVVQRALPMLVVLALASTFGLVLLLPRRSRSAEMRGMRLLPIMSGIAVTASCLAQIHLRPQPLLISDPAAYYDIGGRVAGVLGSALTPDGMASAVEQLRPYGGLWATGLLYGFLLALSGGVTVIYAAHALAMGGTAFWLVRAAARLGGHRVAVTTAVLALAYPPLAVICGIVQPEPVILLLWTLALDLLLTGWPAGDRRRLGASGLAFGLGLALHPQGIWFLLASMILVLVPFVRPLWAVRCRLGAFAIGLLPIVVTTAVGEAYARPETYHLDERHGFWAYTADFPLGLWLFLDADGWQGPHKLEDTRYVQGLRQAEEAGNVNGTLGRLAYTARFVADNLTASIHQILRNEHRLFHEPDDPSGRGFLLPHDIEVPWHRALVVLFLLAAPILWGRSGGVIYLPFLMISATYPFYHVFNKYAVPAVPFVLLGAAFALVRLVERGPVRLALALAIAAAGATVPPAQLAFWGVAPSAARAVFLTLHLGGLTLAFLIAGRHWAADRAQKNVTIAAALILLLPTIGVAVGDVSWRSFELRLDRPARYAVRLGEQGVSHLNRAREAYLLLDLHAPRDDVSPLRLEFDSGLVLSGSDLVPSMPPFGLATHRYHRNPATFPQWWRVAWRPEMAADGRFGLRISGSSDVWLRGELGAQAADGIHEGLSLGEWPNLSVYRLMHDGEYRHPAHQRLGGEGRESRYDGRLLPGTLGIRLIALEEAGRATWETAPTPGGEIVTAIWFLTPRTAGRADIVSPAGSLRVDIGRAGTYKSSDGRVQARVVRPRAETAALVLKLPSVRGTPLRFEAFPLQELSSLVVSADPNPRRTRAPIPPEWADRPFVPLANVLAFRPGQPWRPEVVY